MSFSGSSENCNSESATMLSHVQVPSKMQRRTLGEGRGSWESYSRQESMTFSQLSCACLSLPELLPGKKRVSSCGFAVVILFFFLIYFLLKNNCCAEFCCFLPNLNMNQPQLYICPLLSNLPPISHPFPPLWMIQSPCLSFLSHTANSRWLSILHMVM